MLTLFPSITETESVFDNVVIRRVKWGERSGGVMCHGLSARLENSEENVCQYFILFCFVFVSFLFFFVIYISTLGIFCFLRNAETGALDFKQR